jgi:hypothetical protein
VETLLDRPSSIVGAQYSTGHLAPEKALWGPRIPWNPTRAAISIRALQLESELSARGSRIGPQEPCERLECERVKSERASETCEVVLRTNYLGSVLKIGYLAVQYLTP